MWLDRLPSQSTLTASSTPNRTISPVPVRKTSGLVPQRNGLNLAANRSTSSLGLSSASSDVSLPVTAKVSNTSSLRYEQRPPTDVPNPLAVLRTVLKHPKDTGTHEDDAGSVDLREDEEGGAIDFGGLSLSDYASQTPTLPSRKDITKQQPVQSKVNRERYNEFHESVQQCDEVLESVQTYLTNFKAELGQVSAEIEGLQARSIRLNAQLDNRRKVEKLLGPAVEELSVSPATVRSIADGPIDDVFAKALTEVEARHLAITSKHIDAETNRALEDILPLIEDLKARAIERIRDYLVSKIKALRSPNINAQIIQQQAFLRHKELYPFLSRNHPVLSEEIAQAYANTMRWYFKSNFTRYHAALDKLQLYAFDQTDLLGADTASKKSVLGSNKGQQSQHDGFNLGRRSEVLKSKHESAIPSYVAEDTKKKQYMEVSFRSFNQALVDNASAEYSAVTELFPTHSYQQVSKRVNEILEPTFSLGHELTKSLVETTTDCLGILLCVRLNQHFAFETQRRKVPVLDSYLNYNNILLWPRFQKVMDLHCESLKRVPTSTNRGAAAAFNLVGGNDTSKASVAPHAITQRFGQFLHGILALSADGGDDEPVANSLNRLRNEYETLMSKLAKGAGDAPKRSRFMYNNYSLVLTIIGDTQGKLAEEQKEHFSVSIKDYKAR